MIILETESAPSKECSNNAVEEKGQGPGSTPSELCQEAEF